MPMSRVSIMNLSSQSSIITMLTSTAPNEAGSEGARPGSSYMQPCYLSIVRSFQRSRSPAHDDSAGPENGHTFKHHTCTHICYVRRSYKSDSFALSASFFLFFIFSPCVLSLELPTGTRCTTEGNGNRQTADGMHLLQAQVKQKEPKGREPQGQKKKTRTRHGAQPGIVQCRLPAYP